MPGGVERTPFAVVLRGIRDGRDESQEAFAAELHVSRSLIGSLETKGRPSDEFIRVLTERFPELKAPIDVAVQLTKNEQALKPNQRIDHPSIPRIDSQIAAGQYSEAVDAIYYELDQNIESADWYGMFHLLRRLGHVTASLGRLSESLPNLDMALFLGDLMSLDEDELLSIWLELIGHLQGLDSRQAQLRVDDALWRYPRAGALWHRKGTLHLWEHAYADAYAALTTALQYSKSPDEIYLTRGRVLSEWTHYRDAIGELEKVLSGPRSSLLDPFQAACGRVALAHAFAQVGDPSRAFQEFDKAEAINRLNPTLAYFRGICYEQIGRMDDAIAELNQALAVVHSSLFTSLSVNSLSPLKRREAKRMLISLENNEIDPYLDAKRLKREATFHTQDWRLKQFIERQLEEIDKKDTM